MTAPLLTGPSVAEGDLFAYPYAEFSEVLEVVEVEGDAAWCKVRGRRTEPRRVLLRNLLRDGRKLQRPTHKVKA